MTAAQANVMVMRGEASWCESTSGCKAFADGECEHCGRQVCCEHAVDISKPEQGARYVCFECAEIVAKPLFDAIAAHPEAA